MVIALWAPALFALPGVKTWKLEWAANSEPDLDGYRLYWRTADTEYKDAMSLDIGNVISYQLQAITTDVFLALTAYDTSGNESPFSAEVFFSKDQISPGAPGVLQIVGN